ncbi:hypothetical protein ACSQ67_025944 [Phaseolus vulgaris]
MENYVTLLLEIGKPIFTPSLTYGILRRLLLEEKVEAVKGLSLTTDGNVLQKPKRRRCSSSCSAFAISIPHLRNNTTLFTLQWRPGSLPLWASLLRSPMKSQSPQPSPTSPPSSPTSPLRLHHLRQMAPPQPKIPVPQNPPSL